ncbi:MAG TPA: type II toxin-antitoxin system antitoxin SocA domain-containing protein [Candidatus Saccharimonadales bacterium]|nr:type II toxin-antitoxin system antitoxin SocA domain-containing protein [Candidatus Saccharimonadales bacterium]
MRPQWNLKEIRQMYGLSQSDIAEAIGVKSRSTIVAIESGDRDLTSVELAKLADYLGVELIDLIAFEIPDYDKYREMLVEALRRYTRLTKHGAPKTLLAKLIYFADFAWFYENLKPMSGMKYRRDPYGPVPDQFFRIVDSMVENGEIQLEMKTFDGRANKSQSLSLSDSVVDEPNQYLTAKEIALIDKIVLKWKNSNVDKIVDFTHNQLPWQVTRPNEFIPYELITQEEPNNVY